MSDFSQKNITGVAALLVHVAKIDEKYSNDEKKLITDFIKSYIKDTDAEEILKEAEEIENNSNQLLNFTNIIKKKLMNLNQILFNIYGKLLFLTML